MRRHIVAGNWKMNTNLSETEALITAIKSKLPLASDTVTLYVAPPFVNLYHAFERVRNTEIKVAAQNMHQKASGAYTGEVSADMLKNVGVETVILGHSERRSYFGETDENLAEKVNTVLAEDMETIFCFGEELEDRKSDTHFDVVKSQLQKGIFHISGDQWKHVILAYEPVWAIGTGETASPEQAQEMHAFIRNLISEKYGQKIADSVSILYGGSVKPGNAKEIFAKPDVDGGLIGGASLKADDFVAIANSF